jgi:DNA-3-methyladenine glycosylase II
MERILREWKRGAEVLRACDPKLAPLMARVGPPTPSIQKDPWQALVSSILSQQLSGASADAILTKFKALHPPFPGPDQVRRFKTPRLRGAGLSRQKADYLLSLVEHWKKLPKNRAGWEALSDEAVIQALTEVRGIGDWTAHMFLIFCLGRIDVLPVGDYGVQKGLQLLHGLEALPKAKQVAGLVPHWKGVQSVGAWYVWQILDRKLIRPAAKALEEATP